MFIGIKEIDIFDIYIFGLNIFYSLQGMIKGLGRAKSYVSILIFLSYDMTNPIGILQLYSVSKQDCYENYMNNSAIKYYDDFRCGCGWKWLVSIQITNSFY